jgi:transketolase
MPAVKNDAQFLAGVAKRVRHHILTTTSKAQSGHPTSSLSATDVLTTLFYGGFLRFDPHNSDHPNNDRFILSKGHAAPLLYSLFAAGGLISTEELHTLRDFGSRLEGHPTPFAPFVEVATGSLGQGLSIGVGMALNGKYLDKLPYNTYVLLGDSELAEGSNWEAAEIAAHYELDNLITIVDANRLGQRGETLDGHDVQRIARKFQAFGWRTIICGGHDIKKITAGLNKSISNKYSPAKPVAIVAKTIKGKGFSMWENKNGWHSKQLNDEQLALALSELGDVNLDITGSFAQPANIYPDFDAHSTKPASDIQLPIDYTKIEQNREAYGSTLVELGTENPQMVVLDAEVSNSTYAHMFKEAFPDRFFEMFVAEQNMIGTGLGLAKRGKQVFMSSFAAFLTRAFDQIRVAQYSEPNMVIMGGYPGVSLGKDGATQMGLEDIAMFRTVLNSTVVYPADAVATNKLTKAVAQIGEGIRYIRVTRPESPNLYSADTNFPIGGSHILKQSEKDDFTLLAAGVTLYEALKAHQKLAAEGIFTRVVDLYSIKPIDYQTLYQASEETSGLFTIEDHFAEGGIGEAVRTALFASTTPIYSLAVRNTPRSGTKYDLLAYEKIDANAIYNAVKGVIAQSQNKS